MPTKGLFMNPKIFQFPKRIFNEDEVLNIYKKQFPEIVKEYENVVKSTYFNPEKYKEIVFVKSKEFDRNFNHLLKEYQFIKKDLENLIEFDIKMHKNYALNFWLISYAINEGPVAMYYSKEIERILKKLFPRKEERIQMRDLLLKTDYEIFYYKIIRTSVELFEFLSKFSKFKKLFEAAKKKKSRKRVWNRIFSELKKESNIPLKQFHKNWQWVLNLENKNIFYTIMDEAIENYEENLKIVEKLKEDKRKIKELLNLARRRLPLKEALRLKNSYLLIKYMLWAKDSEFGKKDLKLLPFWSSLTKEIISKFEEKHKVKIPPEKSSFLWIPWVLENYKKARILNHPR
jgi:hypothetical protein